MIVAIYLVEFQKIATTNTVSPIARIEKTSKQRRDNNRKSSSYAKTPVKSKALPCETYDRSGSFVETEQLFNRLA